MNRKVIMTLSAIAATALAVEPALATTTGGMPWDGPLTTVLNSLQGNVARTLILAAIVVTGFTWAFGDHGGGARRMVGILFGGSLALGAATLLGRWV